MENQRENFEKPIELSFPLPLAPETEVRVHLTIRAKYILLHLTTTSIGDTSVLPPLGSFVYALPDRINTTQTISTPLCQNEYSIDLTTRLAKIFARKLQKPVYVGNSISFASAGMGGTSEEEIEGLKMIVGTVMKEIDSHESSA